MTLVILAAGMGTRYGGLKQLDAISNENEGIIDFSIYDAIKYGFKKVVFVVRKDFLKTIKSLYLPKLQDKIKVEFVCQEVTNIPKEFNNNNRVKPWGTAHALLTAKDVVNENFCVINADDFYGSHAFLKMGEFLSKTDSSSSEYTMVGFKIQNTLSENGTVSRGECYLDSGNYLKRVVECTNISLVNNRIVYSENNQEKEIQKNSLVSMNFWGFTPTIFQEMETLFHQFLKENYRTEKEEFYLPSVVNYLLENQIATVKVLETSSNWLGVTYKKDKAAVISKITELKKDGVYPESLWS
ncbi:dTDP-glucose pyrophosphorylase [Tenacibaculum lutimaris]|uniref:dTDP-glucose pyrophosphorylase n=1 Tax=Tenacibaculum lutimaris TaxID=285258 RepID=A0A420E0S4_9FLAO|nr:sugar phosphate nucleotidyltransferase [Tenacibaculum lutimaris]RKF03517.1 dTDP-glucose pyrophosphorylase [Tenacibaculum lutimaris]